MKLSVVIPCYNEQRTIREILSRVLAQPLDMEVIVVDDASTDATRAILAECAAADSRIRVCLQPVNRGKGAALRRGFREATGDLVIVQDADLEYNPSDYAKLVEPILRGDADVVYGSRFLTGPHRVLYFWHSVGNKVLTTFSNALTDLNLTDMETCYKVFRREIIQRIHLEEERFGFEPEVTAKLARIPGIRIYETSIEYHGRTYSEGKKIGVKDGFRALHVMLKFGLVQRFLSLSTRRRAASFLDLFRTETGLLVLLALLLFVVRFRGLGYAPFLLDEPLLQESLDDHLSRGTLPRSGLVGTRNMVYGPAALWLYTPVRLFTAEVSSVLASHLAFFGLGGVLLFFAIRRSAGNLAASWAIALAASSPYLFMYSRMAWDNTYLVFATGLIAFFVSRIGQGRGFRRRNVLVFFGLGASMGLAFNTHLMCLPVLGAAGLLTLFVFWRARGTPLARIALMVACTLSSLAGFAAVTAVYLAETWRSLAQQRGFHLTWEGLETTVPEVLRGTTRYLSAARMDYFFDRPMLPVLEESIGSWLALLVDYDASDILRLLAAGAVVLSLLKFARVGQPILARFGVLSLVCLALYYSGLRLDTHHPHYFMPVWWLPFLFVGLAIARAPIRLQRPFKAVALLVIATNVAFVFANQSRIRQTLGSRGNHYGTSQGEIHRITSEICRRARASGVSQIDVDMSQIPGVFSQSIAFFSRHLSECYGTSLAFWQHSSPVRVSIHYAASPRDSAALELSPP